MNIVFSNCLQQRYKIPSILHWMIGLKSDRICKFKEIISKDLRKAPSSTLVNNIKHNTDLN